MIKKILLATVAVAALGTASASAADLAAHRQYTKAPPMEALPTWAGFYIGAMGGYGSEDGGFASMKGGFAGGTIGYNWQQGSLVYGLEADAAWADISASVNGFVPGLGLVGVSSKIDATGTVRGRIGYAFGPTLVYATGGYAWADNKLSASALGTSISDSQFLSGYAVGAGLEYMIAPKWSFKAEYLYKSFDGKSYFNGSVPTGDLNLHSVQVGVNYHF